MATPNVAVTLLRAGEYLIDADGEASTTVVTVRSSNASVTGGGLAFPVHAGQSARIVGMDSPEQQVGGAACARRFRNLGRRARCPGRRFRVRALCSARDDGL